MGLGMRDVVKFACAYAVVLLASSVWQLVCGLVPMGLGFLIALGAGAVCGCPRCCAALCHLRRSTSRLFAGERPGPVYTRREAAAQAVQGAGQMNAL